jgi:hypothetical protein
VAPPAAPPVAPPHGATEYGQPQVQPQPLQPQPQPQPQVQAQPQPQPQTLQQPQAGVPFGTPPAVAPQGTAPFGAPAYGAPAAPWGAGPQAAATSSGRSPIDLLLTGDWGGAATVAGIAVGVMTAVSLVGMLLLTKADAGFRATLSLVVAGVCAAVGGDPFVSADARGFDLGSASIGVLPLTITFAGLGVLGWLFAKRLRATGTSTTRDVALQAVRTALVFAGFFLVLALLSRYRPDQPLLSMSGQFGVSIWGSVIGALLFAAVTLALVWVGSRSAVLPGRLGAIRDKAAAPLLGAVAVFAVAGAILVLAGLVYGLVNADEKVAQLGAFVLAAGNGMLATTLWAAGVPLSVEGAGGARGVGELPGQGSIDLFTFTDGSGWFWLAPVVLLAVLLAVATALTVRQNSIEDARREGFRFAGALALVAFVATLLLRISAHAEGTGLAALATGKGSAMFNPVIAAFALAVWGIVAGLVGPVVATKVPGSFVTAVRGRFGAAPVAPAPVVPAPVAPAPVVPPAGPVYGAMPQADQPPMYEGGPVLPTGTPPPPPPAPGVPPAPAG